MAIRVILRESSFDSDTYIYLERYVNQGSPSGFTDTYTTSTETSPKSPTKSFFLCAPTFPRDVSFRDFGDQPEFFRKWQMLVHPDMIADGFFASCEKVDQCAVLVSPTSSARTVKIVGEDGWFLKLHYKGLIGRFPRIIGVDNAESAVQVSSVISDAINNGKMPKSFYLMREKFARVAKSTVMGSATEWGIVLREPTPYRRDPELSLLIPGFSLFSADVNHPEDPSILKQLIDGQSKVVEDFLLEDLIMPAFDAYFTLLIKCGLELEAQAQNMLFAIDKDLHVKGVVARDMESVDKDISLMRDMGIPNHFEITPWKCLLREQSDYHKMHSFMFDFKLGEYLITPIIDEAAKHYQIDEGRIITSIREYNQSYLSQLPSDFFPSDGKWYSYQNIVRDRTKDRPWIANPYPRYR